MHLLLAALIPLALAAPAHAASDAACEITLGQSRITGPCAFTPRQGGSFDVTLGDGISVNGASALSLEITGKGVGSLTGKGQDWGKATRQTDGACWAATGLTLCVRAAADAATDATPATAATPAPTTAELQSAFGARCHMGGCNWVIQSPPRETGEGSTAIPGRRVEVQVRNASQMYPGDYPDHPEPGLDWSAPYAEEYFCSTIRPAFATGDGGWQVLDLPQIFGASEAVSLKYLKACHSDVGNDPYAAMPGLYRNVSPDAGKLFADFDSLIRE